MRQFLNKKITYNLFHVRYFSSVQSSRVAHQSLNIDTSALCIGYNDKIYQDMKNDRNRTLFYENAIRKYCPHKTVVDIGCGSLLLLSTMAADPNIGNAKNVYAMEINECAFKEAENNLKQLISDSKNANDQNFTNIELFNGHSKVISLPNNDKCDIIVHEIIGEISTCEGVFSTIRDAKKRFLNHSNDVWSIPHSIKTFLTPVEFPDSQYWQSLSEKVIDSGSEMKSINLWNFPLRHFICYGPKNDSSKYEDIHWGIWEDIIFNQRMNSMESELDLNMDNMQFVCSKNSTIGGLLTSIEICVDAYSQIPSILSNKNVSNNNCMWANKLIIFDEKLAVNKNDIICVSACSDVENDDNIVNYDFTVSVNNSP